MERGQYHHTWLIFLEDMSQWPEGAAREPVAHIFIKYEPNMIILPEYRVCSYLIYTTIMTKNLSQLQKI